MRTFDYMEFTDNYGVLFDANKYTREQALEIYFEEYAHPTDSIEDLFIEEVWVRWKPKMSKDEMDYYDIFDNADNRGIYNVCEKEDKKAFKCWRVRR